MSLNNIIDNVLQIARNNNITESEHISRYQIELWVNYYRAMLIKQSIDKGYDVDEAYVTILEPIHLDRVQIVPGKFVFVGEKELPTLINFRYNPGVIGVRDMFGNLIQLGSYTNAKLQKYSQATCKDYIGWVKNNKIYVEGDSNQLEYISIDAILQDPTKDIPCYDPDDEYPVPAAMVPTIVQMILEKELRVLVTQPSDVTNDSKDDTQNIYSKK